MQTLDRQERTSSPLDVEVLFPEARHRERRRRPTIAVLLVVVGSGIGLAAGLSEGPPRGPTVLAAQHSSSPIFPLAGTIESREPFALAALSSQTIGAIASTANGDLYFVDLDHNTIDVLTAVGPRTVITGPKKAVTPMPSDFRVTYISGLSVSTNRLWFADGGALYEADLDGSHLQEIPAPRGVDLVQALGNGAVVYCAEPAKQGGNIYERFADGRTVLLAGVADHRIGENPYERSEQGRVPSTSAGISPTSIALASDGVLWIVNGDNTLDESHNGVLVQVSAPAFFNGGWLATSSTGVVYGVINDSNVVYRMEGSGAIPIGRVPGETNDQVHSATSLATPMSIAAAPGGAIYLSYTDTVGAPKSAWRSGIQWVNASGKEKLLVVSRAH
jgi:hypothetical protein